MPIYGLEVSRFGTLVVIVLCDVKNRVIIPRTNRSKDVALFVPSCCLAGCHRASLTAIYAASHGLFLRSKVKQSRTASVSELEFPLTETQKEVAVH